MKQEDTIDYLLKVVWQNMSNTYNQIASGFEITQAIGYVLISVSQDGIAVTKLAALLGVKSTSLSRILNNMEESGLLYRAAAPGDKRSAIVYLTDFGKEKRQVAKGVVRSFNEYLDKNLTAHEKNNLMQILQKVNQLTLAYTVTTENDEQKDK